jgi:adenosylmethionine-8-amino-7-oxononanoate aminotransferase
MTEQASAVDYVHASQFASEPVQRFADRLAPHVPMDAARVFPVSGGSEAVESAIKLARAYQLAVGQEDRHIIIARSASYHGNSRAALDASDRSTLRAGYEPWLGQTVRVSAPNPYREARIGLDYAAELDRVIVDVGPERVAAFLAEPISGATMGAVSPPDDYWSAIAEVCRRRGVLLIADEVMTGFGRTGRWFGIDHWETRPDIITAGKGASSGYWPLGLMIASAAVHDAVVAAGTFGHGFTWSHHPTGAAVADEVVRIIERERLVERSAAMGERLGARLRQQLADHPRVGDIRGRGLLWAVEFVADRESKTPFERSAKVIERVVSAAFDRRLTVYPCASAVDGRVGDAAILGPTLTVTEQQLDEMADRLAAAIRVVLV